MKKIDKIIINLISFGLILVWTNYFIKNFVEALFVALLVFVTLRTIALHLINRFTNKKNITVSEMSQCFAIMGAEGVCQNILSTLPECYNAGIENSCIILQKNNDTLLVSPNFKMSAVSADDIAKVWRFAKEKNISKIYILARLHQRSVILFGNSLEGDITFIAAKKLHKYLVLHNALPKKNFHQKKSKSSVSFKDALSAVFVRKRAKLFLFSGITLAALAFFSPLTIYYLIMASLSLGLGVACFVVNN